LNTSTSATSDLERRVLACIDDEETTRLLCELIGIPSDNPPGTETAVATRLSRSLRSAGLDPHLDTIEPGRANLEVSFGGDSGPTLLFNGHTDTVPTGPGWTRDPYHAIIDGGRVYGRGACDMKGGLAAITQALISIVRARIPLHGRVIFDAVIDEESGGLGTRRTIEHGRQADWAIIAEPTELQVLRASNGEIVTEVTFNGLAAHGSTPEAGRNAICDAAAFVALLEQQARTWASNRHPLTGPPTYNVGTIEGGVKPWIVPAQCMVTVDRRIIPGQTQEEAGADLDWILERLQANRPGLSFKKRVLVSLPTVVIPEDLPVCQVLRQAIAEIRGHDVDFGGLRATSDAAVLVQSGIPTVVFGPGSITQAAHRSDEFVPLQEVHQAVRAFALAIVRLLA